MPLRLAWNAWAKEMLAQQAKLIETGEWMTEVPIEMGKLEGKNAATQDWLKAARSDFSGQSFKNEVDFSNFEFPGEVEFAKAELPKRIRFRNATFGGYAWFMTRRS
jgi:hypothetical protein